MTDITVTDTPHGLHLDMPGSPGLTISSDEVAAIVQHELGKLGLWWAKEQRALVVTAPHEAPDGTTCFVWHPHGDIAIRHVSRFEGCRRKIADAPTTALDKVRGALAEHPRCDRHGGDDPVTCGWKSAVLDVQAALDGADS